MKKSTERSEKPLPMTKQEYMTALNSLTPRTRMAVLMAEMEARGLPIPELPICDSQEDDGKS